MGGLSLIRTNFSVPWEFELTDFNVSYLLFSRKKSKTVIIVKNRISPGGLNEMGAIRNWGLIRSFTVYKSNP